MVDSYGRETSIGNTAEYGGQPFLRCRYNEKGDIRKAAQHTYSVFSTGLPRSRHHSQKYRQSGIKLTITHNEPMLNYLAGLSTRDNTSFIPS